MRQFTRWLVVAAALVSPGSVLAGEEPARGDLSFPGGTVQQYVEAVSKSFGSANAGVFPGAESLTIAPVQLKQVSRDEALHLLEALSGGLVAVKPRGDVYAVQPEHPGARISVDEVRVWSLAPVLQRMKAEEALSAVGAALDLAGAGARVKFHQDTTLLIVSGSPQHLDAAQRVVDRLESVAGWRSSEADRAAHPREPAADELESLKAKVDQLQKDLAGANQALKFLLSRNQDPPQPAAQPGTQAP